MPNYHSPTPRLNHSTFGSSIKSRSYSAGSGFRFGFNTQEKDKEIYSNNETYTATFWEYDGRLGRRWNVDPKPKKSLSIYCAFSNNPIYYCDPFGDTTFVREGKKGLYEVIGGTLNDNYNGIYIKGNDGKLGKMIGYSATPESFYNSEAQQWSGTINPNDQSGTNFLNNLKSLNPNLVSYMMNSLGKGKYNFKQTNGTSNILFKKVKDYYRGMPLALQGNNTSMPVFASARDVGNIGAGLVAGMAGLSWTSARLGFDLQETRQENTNITGFMIDIVCGDLQREGSGTQFSEMLGFRIGSQIRQSKLNEQLTRLPSNGRLPQITVSNSIITRSDYTPW